MRSKNNRKETIDKYPCVDYLHNALRALSNGKVDSAYREICWALSKVGEELSEEEKVKFAKLLEEAADKR